MCYTTALDGTDAEVTGKMMRSENRYGSNTDDVAATVISINRSVVFWENVEVCRWFEALQFDRKVNNR